MMFYSPASFGVGAARPGRRPRPEPTLRPKMPRAEEAGGQGTACNGLCNETVGNSEDSRSPEGLDVAIAVCCGP